MPSRTLRLAAAALGTAGHIEQALPGDITASSKAEDIIFCRIFEVNRLTF